jgi:membrane glycosyltransferase
MSYGSALLWFFFLLASSLEALSSILATPVYFPEGPSLFPDWPRYFPAWALALLSSTALALFFPKALSVAVAAAQGRARAFGGLARLCLSVALEVAVSAFLAPVRMLFHSLFVVTTFLGFKVAWGAQNRDRSGGLAWGAAFRLHWFGSLLGVAWGLSMYAVSPGFFLWLSPVAAGLALSVPLSVLTSRASLGSLAARLGLLKTPAETEPPREVRELAEGLRSPDPPSALAIPMGQGFARAVVLPETLGTHLAVSGKRRKPGPAKRAWLEAVSKKALAEGPGSLTAREKKALLNDPERLTSLHWAVWRLEGEQARLWGLSD